MPDNLTAAPDDTRRPSILLLKYGAPLSVLISSQWWSEYLGVDTFLITVVWTIGLTVMGVGCVLNARRCSRVHCHFTGPWMLVFAIAFLLYGSGIYRPDWVSFTQLANISLWGAGLLWIITELIFGKYFVGHKRAR